MESGAKHYDYDCQCHGEDYKRVFRLISSLFDAEVSGASTIHDVVDGLQALNDSPYRGSGIPRLSQAKKDHLSDHWRETFQTDGLVLVQLLEPFYNLEFVLSIRQPHPHLDEIAKKAISWRPPITGVKVVSGILGDVVNIPLADDLASRFSFQDNLGEVRHYRLELLMASMEAIWKIHRPNDITDLAWLFLKQLKALLYMAAAQRILGERKPNFVALLNLILRGNWLLGFTYPGREAAFYCAESR